MKRLGMNKTTVVYSREDMPKDETKSMFLAGPVPRKEYELSWKKEAIDKVDWTNTGMILQGIKD